MRDNFSCKEITMLSEDRTSGNVPSVYTRINDPAAGTSEDPFDVENDHHYAFEGPPHVVKATTNVVVIPSINKWNCFSLRDRRLAATDHNMNTATSPTYESKVTIPANYPGQAAGDLSTSAEYRRAILREKVTKQRSEQQEGEQPRLRKTKSLAAPSYYHRPTTRTQSNDAITEERTVFGFKIMKGLEGNAGNTTRSFTRGTSLRQPVRTTHKNNSNINTFRDKAGNRLFYTPTNNRVSENTHDIVQEKSEKDGELPSEAKPDCTKTPRNIERADENVDDLRSRESFNTKETRNFHDNSKEPQQTGDKSSDNEVIGKTDRAGQDKKAETLPIRAESLREGKSRLEEFREKQRRGKLTRSLTNPDFEQSTPSSKEKNISESLAEIRERIRERRKKKEQSRKSQSSPEPESLPKCEENVKEQTRNATDSVTTHKDVKVNIEEDVVDSKDRSNKHTGVEIRKNDDKSKEKSYNTTDSIKKTTEFERNEGSHEPEHLELEENCKISRKRDVVDTSSEKVMTNDSKCEEEIVRPTEDQGIASETKDLTKTEVQEDEKQGKTAEIKGILSNETEESEKTLTEAKVNEQGKVEVKKLTKRERRRAERYQRSKTMSAIMYNEISQEAKRETQHKGETSDAPAIPSVSEIKKRFLQTEGTKISELGLFYSQKTAKKSPKTVTSLRRKTEDVNKKKEIHTKTNLSRRHTLPAGTMLENQDAQDETKIRKDISATENTKSRESFAKIPLSRRHTLPTYATETVGDRQNDKVAERGGRPPIRRHTICSQTSWTIRHHNPNKLSETATALRDKFSKGTSPEFNLATGKSIPGKTIENHVERRRVKSESGVDSGNEIDVNRTNTRSSLSRRHTIGNRPGLEKQNTERKERQQSSEKSVVRNGEIVRKTDHRKTKQESKRDEKSRRKDEKSSVSKLRKLFLGQTASSEKKTRLRERRAKTIAGVETDESKDLDVIPNKYVKPDLYVNNMSPKAAEIAQPERRRRSSDLNPDTYLSPTEETGNVFDEEIKGTKSISDDIKTPDKPAAEISLPDLNLQKRRSDSESEISGLSFIKDQNLDDYLTTIKTMAETPKAKRKSPSSSPRKEKFTTTQSFDKDEESGSKQHLNVVKPNLSMHSWSTSDLDKLIHGADGVRSGSQVDVSSMDFDEISSSTTRLHSLTEGRTKARPKRTSSKSLNPMKSLMERSDVRTHTEETEGENKSGFEKPKKRSNPRKKRSQLEPWRRHTLDPVALAALASREDFSRVSLRKTKGPGKEKNEYDGSLPVMLIQVKGRRQVQVRLVEPSLSSLNNGDCFILVTPKELFCWIGQHANTIEKAKAVEISSKIQKRGDMNCKTGDVLYIDETKQGNTLAYRKFCKILEGDVDFPIEEAKMCPDDEFYEREMISTNKVYKLQEGDPPHLLPIAEHCGYMPKIAVLNTKEVFVFDFGSELYVWTGQQSLSNKRKVAFHLAEMLYKQQFDCEAVVSPIDPRRSMKRPQGSKPTYRDAEGREHRRPAWTLFARLHEKAETLLFQEKFFDWPDPTKIIKMKGHVSSGEIQERPPAIELRPCDPKEMQQPASDLEPVILETTNLGRGFGTPNIEVNGEIKEGDQVTTLGMKVWLVTQNKHFVLPKSSEGHFHSGDGYVIRWVYFVAKNRVVRDKRGRVRPLTGRQRCAYFFWQGNECSVNEKGAAAIVAVELDEEHGPQIRVVEGKEPPHFLKLFDGAMVIHRGKRVRVNEEEDEFSDKSSVRMYCVRNEDITEGCLVQVKRSASSLRSRSSFIVVDSELGSIFIWHGCKSSEYHRKNAEKAANFIKERHPIEMNLSKQVTTTLIQVEEGQEPKIFWKTVTGKKKSYLSLSKDPVNYDFCPRLYHMTSATGPFTFTEILCPSRYPGRTCPFPVLQDDLYSANQPAVFVFDVGDEVYVWEGWMPAEITKDKRGSAKRRWDEERKLTLETTLAYVKDSNHQMKKGAYVVQAGLEPLSFTTHFPFWNRREDIAEIKSTEGKTEREKKPVQDVLNNFTRKYYSFHKLISDSPPDGIDLSRLETYLTDDEFQKIFEMSRELFGKLPGWKQDVLKKAFGLF